MYKQQGKGKCMINEREKDYFVLSSNQETYFFEMS